VSGGTDVANRSDPFSTAPAPARAGSAHVGSVVFADDISTFDDVVMGAASKTKTI
jgi:hypothetical protein